MAVANRVEINGRVPELAELRRQAVHNYGHFTVMQVRHGCVRGLALHLQRLRDSSHELFGHALEPDRLRELLRHALRGTASAVTVRINVFAVSAPPGEPVEPDVMISVSPPSSDVPAHAWRVRATQYERDLAHVKHVGFFGVMHQRRLAHDDGFDDVLFTDRDRRISEGGIWNVGFWDGRSVVWPEARKLPGITAQLLATGLDTIGVPTVTRPITLEEVPEFTAAFATYSNYPGQPVASIDGVVLPGDDRLPALLAQAWESQPPEIV